MANRIVKFDFNPFEIAGIRTRDQDKRDEILKKVADLVKTEVLGATFDGESPVRNGKWKRSLSKEYKKKKLSEGGEGFADLRLEGDLMQSLTVDEISATTLRLTVSDDQQGKADGHNNFSGKSKLPIREFIPGRNRLTSRFNEKIEEKIKKIVDEVIGESDQSNP